MMIAIFVQIHFLFQIAMAKGSQRKKTTGLKMVKAKKRSLAMKKKPAKTSAYSVTRKACLSFGLSSPAKQYQRKVTVTVTDRFQAKRSR